MARLATPNHEDHDMEIPKVRGHCQGSVEDVGRIIATSPDLLPSGDLHRSPRSPCIQTNMHKGASNFPYSQSTVLYIYVHRAGPFLS